MKKISVTQVIAFTFLLVLVSIAIAQTAGKGWEKTVTLSSGEVILDMSGEWDVHDEFYGPFSSFDPSPEIVTITQKGTKFTAIKQIGSKWVPKGAETLKGELGKDGFKKIYYYVGALAMDGSFVWEECEWKISADGNTVNIDCGKRIKSTLTRK